MTNLLMTLCLCISVYSHHVMALQSVDDLLNQNKLIISQEVKQAEQQIAGQALVISIKVATDRWFATGSQVQGFALQNVVMQANNIVTFNGSERINGASWATQTHEITLYPTAAGTYLLPAIDMKVSINTENDGIISGTISTAETSFDVVIPEALQGIDSYIVSTNASIEVDGQFDAEHQYAIGEAITQTITITASDIPAMMIPEVNGGQTVGDGVSIYHKPAKVFDKSNRGVSIGTRIEEFTYIFEKAGNYAIKEQTIFWWNSDSNSLEPLIVPASSWTVASGQVSNNSQFVLFKSFNINSQTIKLITILIFALIFVYTIFNKRHYLSRLYKRLTKYEERALRQQFYTSVSVKDYISATQYLYEYALLKNGHEKMVESGLLTVLNELAFSEKDKVDANNLAKDKTSLKQQVAFSLADAKTLINDVNQYKHTKVTQAIFTAHKRIKLNQNS